MKRFASFIIILLAAVLLPRAAVQAAEQENVVLTAGKNGVKVEIRLPGDSQGASTLKLRLKVEGDTAKLNQDEPFTLQTGAEISSTLLETRFQAETGYLTVYISDTDKITDAAEFELGTIIPNSVDESEYGLTFSAPADGLEFVDGTGALNENTEVVSSPVAVKVNAADDTEEDNPGDKPGGDEDDTSGGETGGNPSGTPSGSGGGNSTTSGSGNSTSSGSGSQNAQDKAANTGDSSNLFLYLVLAGLSAAGVGTTVVLKRFRSGRQ